MKKSKSKEGIKNLGMKKGKKVTRVSGVVSGKCSYSKYPGHLIGEHDAGLGASKPYGKGKVDSDGDYD